MRDIYLEKQKQITAKALQIIGKKSVTFLAETLGVSRATIDKRLRQHDWKYFDVLVIEDLLRELSIVSYNIPSDDLSCTIV